MFPYWFLGWNYFNPRSDSHEIWLVTNQQFSHSMLNMGFRLPAFEAGPAEAWRDQNMGSFSGYLTLKHALDRLNHCEPKDSRFPFKPTLCRQWWTEEHQRSCGYVSPEAIKQVQDEGA